MSSERHHYLPEFYIKGFLNSDNKVYVFDKREGKFKKNEFSPKQIFYEWNRNTLLIEGQKDNFLEKRYGDFDSLLSPTYNKIKNQSDGMQYNVNDILDLIILVSLTHWRIPLNDENAQSLVQSTSNKELMIKIFNRETREEASESFYTKVKELNGFVEIYKLAKPMFDLASLDDEDIIDNWKIYSRDSQSALHILGDNPIIFKNRPQSNILETELVFPLTKSATLHHIKTKKIKQIPFEWRVKVDLLIFLQSERYVVGSNKNYLKTIHLAAQGYNTEFRIQSLRKEIFDIFE